MYFLYLLLNREVLIAAPDGDLTHSVIYEWYRDYHLKKHRIKSSYAQWTMVLASPAVKKLL